MIRAPYPAYRDSAVDWLGNVPAEWQVRKLNRIAKLETGHTPSRQHPEYWVEDECVIPWFTLADVGFLRDERNVFIDTTQQRISQLGLEHSAARLLPSGTVILSRTASVGFSGITSIQLAVSQDFAAWICGEELQPQYLLWCLRAMKREFSRLMMGSTHQTIYMPDIEAFRVPVPPVSTQSAIAAYLDHETAKIDGLVAEQERLMALLKEKRQAVISHAVTKGLNPKAKMKHSGVEWLGEVPEHWEVRPIKSLGAITGGATPSKERLDFWLGDTPWVSPKDMKVWIVQGEADFVSTDAIAAANLSIIPPGAVLFVVRGMILAKTFPIALSGRPMTINQDMKALVPGDGISGPYLAHLLAASRDIVAALIDEAGHGTRALRMEGFLSLKLGIPPVTEQRQIENFITEATGGLDTLTAEATRAITLLRERRAALISAAVTGKIDVRGFAPPVAA